MSDNFSGIVKSLASPAGFLGSVGNAIFSKNTKRPTPKPKVLSSSVMIVFAGTPIEGLPYEIEIGELEEFNARKSFNVVKKFKPFGSKLEEVIVEDTGWELSFGGAKVDWRGAYLFYLNELALIGVNKSNSPKRGNTLGESETLYIAPKFKIIQAITHYDGVIEEFIYNDVTLLDYDISIAGDNQPIPERFSAHAKDRYASEYFSNHETTKITNSIDEMLDIIKTSGRF